MPIEYIPGILKNFRSKTEKFLVISKNNITFAVPKEKIVLKNISGKIAQGKLETLNMKPETKLVRSSRG